MKGSRFIEEQIIAILREQEAGAKTVDVCRKHGISSATFYKWKSKYGGLEVSDARRLKVLEDENRKLKKLLAEAMLDRRTIAVWLSVMLTASTKPLKCFDRSLRKSASQLWGGPISAHTTNCCASSFSRSVSPSTSR